MPLFSVIIPTYNHADTIIWAIKSVQTQTLQDFEILVVGDGVPDRTREIMKELCKEDKRIVFFDNPKGEAKGELYRHKTVKAAKGKYIAYLGDDDLWNEKHLQYLSEGLENADFCNTLQGEVMPDGSLMLIPGDISREYCRETLLLFKYNFFGPTCVGHTKSAYAKLPYGWRPTPKDVWTDLYMWRQWFSVNNIRYVTLPHITTLHLGSPGRGAASISERVKESKLWFKVINDEALFGVHEVNAFRNLALSQGCSWYHAKRLKIESMDTRKELDALLASQATTS